VSDILTIGCVSSETSPTTMSRFDQPDLHLHFANSEVAFLRINLPFERFKELDAKNIGDATNPPSSARR
jgi:hypothetical protein